MGSRSPLQNVAGDSMDQVASLVFSFSFSAPVFIQVLASFLYWLPLWSNTWQSTHCQPTQPRGNRPFFPLGRPSKIIVCLDQKLPYGCSLWTGRCIGWLSEGHKPYFSGQGNSIQFNKTVDYYLPKLVE